MTTLQQDDLFKRDNSFGAARGGGGALSYKRLMGICHAGWGRIFTTGLPIMGLHFQKSYWSRVAHFRIFGVESCSY